MKLFSCLLLALVGIWSVNGASVCSKSENLFEIEIISATLTELVRAYVNVWIVNSDHPLQLPINSDEVSPYIYVDHSTSLAPRTKTPVWKTSFNISADIFSEQSYMALELWTQIDSSGEQIYLGGNELTVAQFEQYDKFCHLAMLDENQKRVGILALKWTKDSSAC